jgi:hypothetical protein
MGVARRNAKPLRLRFYIWPLSPNSSLGLDGSFNLSLTVNTFVLYYPLTSIL